MNVLYCGDKNIEKGLIISILSLLKNVKEELKIYVLTINLKTGEKQIQGVTNKCIEILDKEIPTINLETRFTPCCMLRLFADEIPELPDKILYLDNDVIARKDCTQFYHQNIEEYEFARSFRLLWKMVFQK